MMPSLRCPACSRPLSLPLPARCPECASPTDRPPTSVGGFLFAVLTQAFVIGTFDRLDLSRTTKGKVTLTLQWRVAFFPLPPKTLPWREHEDMRVIQVETSWLELLVLFQLLGS